jgi:hypothetical protein
MIQVTAVTDKNHSINIVGYNIVPGLAFILLCRMSFDDVAFMVNCLDDMRKSQNLPYWYQFPSLKERPDIILRIIKRTEDSYALESQLGLITLSKMDHTEFTELFFELQSLPNETIGSKVYFPPVKDIFKK